jgi:uncharacterized membrane protein
MIVQDACIISAPIERVWDVFSDVERWPEWNASVTDLTVVSGPVLAIGSRVRIKQPLLPVLVWEVTTVQPGRSWAWTSRSVGARTTATHQLRSIDSATTHVEQTIEHTGAVGVLVGRLMRRLTRRYLATEAAGLTARSEANVTTA